MAYAEEEEEAHARPEGDDPRCDEQCEYEYQQVESCKDDGSCSLSQAQPSIEGHGGIDAVEGLGVGLGEALEGTVGHHGGRGPAEGDL